MPARALNFPDGHSLHLKWDVVAVNFPAGQSEHLACPFFAANEPAAQYLQSPMPSAEN
jgi:hypothetical protein